ncbi:MAG: hypothetical protein L3J04_10310 [Robiginitomaculum sp.]|nr:hypothetical protein [Robiginitomaculum sp.]
MNKTFFIGVILLFIVFSVFSLIKSKEPEKPIKEATESLMANVNEYSKFRELAQQLQNISQANAEQVSGAATDILEINEDIKQSFDRFAKLAVSTATKIDDTNGPQDLACIFRGMSADAIDKLRALQAATNLKQQEALWREAAELFGDVDLVLTPRPDLPPWSGETCSA